MAVVDELLRSEADGALSFGNHTLAQKTKKEDVEIAGDVYKVKTYNEITKLEKNGSFVYESVPGTSVNHFVETADGVEFTVEGDGSAEITLELAEETSYDVTISGNDTGTMQTNLGGKLSISVSFADAPIAIKVTRQ